MRLNYPPFTYIIKISRLSDDRHSLKDMEKLTNLLSAYNPITFDSPHNLDSQKKMSNLIIKINPHDWPNQELSEVLNYLPPYFIVSINPPDII